MQSWQQQDPQHAVPSVSFGQDSLNFCPFGIHDQHWAFPSLVLEAEKFANSEYPLGAHYLQQDCQICPQWLVHVVLVKGSFPK